MTRYIVRSLKETLPFLAAALFALSLIVLVGVGNARAQDAAPAPDAGAPSDQPASVDQGAPSDNTQPADQPAGADQGAGGDQNTGGESVSPGNDQFSADVAAGNAELTDPNNQDAALQQLAVTGDESQDAGAAVSGDQQGGEGGTVDLSTYPSEEDALTASPDAADVATSEVDAAQPGTADDPNNTSADAAALVDQQQALDEAVQAQAQEEAQAQEAQAQEAQTQEAQTQTDTSGAGGSSDTVTQ